MAWYCAKCNQEAEEVFDIKITYKDLELPDASGIRCESCGAELLEEQFVMLELLSAEEMLEGK